MMTIEELETACDISTAMEMPAHELEGPPLLLRRMFYPSGFPAEVRTNSPEIMAEMERVWGIFAQQFATEAIRVDIQVTDDDDTAECPPEPRYCILPPLVVAVADSRNYMIADEARNITHIKVSRAALRYPAYLRYFFLEYSCSYEIEARFATPIHAGCVALNGSGILLCGDSGAGKSTLSYACARAGWTYISDDASLLLHADARTRKITGNCHQVRFRPTASQIFPEIEGLEITPRANGKPSIELPTADLPHFTRSSHTIADYIVFLNRRVEGPPELRPYGVNIARQYMRQVLYGCRETLATQYEAIEHLLTAEVYELRYSQLDWAIDRLRRLVEEGS